MKRGYGHSLVRYMMAAMLVAVAVAGCDVHEFPVVPEQIPFVLRLDSRTQLPIHEEIYFTKQTTHTTAEHDRRYVINAYRSHDGETFSRKADTTIVYTTHMEDDEISIALNLQRGDYYRFMVWSDHVAKGTHRDKYYNTTDFAEITYADRAAYEGCNDFKDAFRGTVQTAVLYEQYPDGDMVEQVVNMELERPLAKFKFIATDVEDFVERELERTATKDEHVPRSVNPDDYRVVFYYTGFMPCSFNMFTNKPNDSWIGVTFDGKMVPIGSDEMELGFDYVLVNGTESKITVVAEVYDKEGELLSRTKTVEVPLVRSKLTVVRGPFLTSMATGNIGIVTEYDGDINIEIV